MKTTENILKRASLLLFAMLMVAFASAATDKKFTLVIDAGHGGNDAGAVGAISKEKNINLSVALAFGKLVERNCADVRVVYTRTTDKFVTLQGRADIANKVKADLFVSIHTNALPKGKYAKGFEVYTLGMHRAGDNLEVAKRENAVITMESDYKSRYQGFDPNSAESYIIFEYMQDKNMENSVKLAKLIQNNVCSSASRINKGVHQAGFLVLRETSMPSCLIELGFISTPDEERQLNDAAVQSKIARGIFTAFQRYRGKSAQVEEEVAQPTQTISATQLVEYDKAKTVVSEPENTVLADQKSSSEEVKTPLSQPAEKEVVAKSDNPVFKIQILVATRVLKKGDANLKGLEGTDYYREGGAVKYTYGSSENYNEIYQLRKTILDKFPQAFIIAFKGDQKVNVSEAMREWKSKR